MTVEKLEENLKKLCWQQVALEHETFAPHPSWVGDEPQIW